MAKNLLKPKETDKATFFSPTNEWCLPAPSVIKPKLVRKDLNSAKLETVRVSKSPTTVVKANGEVHTKEEATVYVKELDLFVTVKLLERYTGCSFTPKILPRSRYSCEWTTGQNPQLIKDGRRIKCNTANYVPIVVPWIIDKLFKLSNTYISTSVLQEAEHPASTRSESSSTTVWRPGGWGPQRMSTTGGGGPARLPNLRVCKHLLTSGGTRRGRRAN